MLLGVMEHRVPFYHGEAHIASNTRKGTFGQLRKFSYGSACAVCAG